MATFGRRRATLLDHSISRPLLGLLRHENIVRIGLGQSLVSGGDLRQLQQLGFLARV
jgi:hypothetical protein